MFWSSEDQKLNRFKCQALWQALGKCLWNDLQKKKHKYYTESLETIYEQSLRAPFYAIQAWLLLFPAKYSIDELIVY